MDKVWKFISNKSKETWSYLKGKKLIIGTSIILLSQGASLLFPDLLTELEYEYIEALGAAIASIGLIDKPSYGKLANDAIRKAQVFGKKIQKENK